MGMYVIFLGVDATDLRDWTTQSLRYLGLG